MPRHLLARVLRALLALWFVLSVGEPSVVRICPMHSSAAAELADAGLGEISPSSHGADAAHHASGHHAHHGGTSHSHSADQHQHHCTCINCCVGSTSSAVAASRVQLEPARIVAVAAQSVARHDVPALDDPPYLLPPGTGPPRV